MKSALFRSVSLALLLALPLPLNAAPTGGREEVPVWRYTVKPGDNLINIAERYFARAEQWPKVQKSNRIADPHRILPGTVLRIPADMLRRAPAQAMLASVNGVVRWRGNDTEWQDAASGQQLVSGAALETQENSSALLILADGSRIVVSPNSQIVLDTLSLYADGLMADTRMRLQQGQADIQANPQQRSHQSLKIQTPSAQAVVRGTRFRLGVDDGATREETVEGLVMVSAAGVGVDVPKGRGTVAKTGQPPMRPVPLLPAADVAGLPARFERLPMRFPLPRFAGAVDWQGQVATDTTFERILLGKSARGDSLTFADLPNGDYVLRLRAIDANGLQGLDALHAFTVFARPFPPGLNRPGEAATIRTATPALAWGDVVDVARYHIQLAASADFASPLYDEIVDQVGWQVPEELPAGTLYWRAASITVDGQQGPWATAAFTYKPGPGAVDLGRAALQIEAERLSLKLEMPPEGLFYEAVLSADQQMVPALARIRSDDGMLELPRPDAGTYYLGVRLVDRSDNTPGPMSIQKVEIPPSRLWLLLLLLLPAL